MYSSVSSKGFTWEYFAFGSGPEIIFAFHGFDNDATDFRVFEKVFGKRYTLVAINLFFHGKSITPRQNAEDVFSTEILLELFNQVLFNYSCQRFSLMGFSLGGRIILQLLPYFSKRIDRVILLAADGLKISRWYIFITNTALGKWLFKRVVHSADRFLWISKLFYRTGLVGEKQYHFAMSNFDTLEKRKKVYNVWMIFRHILPDPKEVGKALRQDPIPVDAYFGKRDTIIPHAFGKYFSKKSGYPLNIHVLDAGHNLMKERIATELLPWVEDKKKVPE